MDLKKITLNLRSLIHNYYTKFMKYIFSLLVLLTFSTLVRAQVNPPVSSANGSTNSVMPTGNSGAMANQTQQVDLSTGGVSLSIPIYSLGSIQLSTNVSLSYQTPTSSFWENEYPSSWVGRDWVLNAGGVITKEIYPGSISDTSVFPIYPRDCYDSPRNCWDMQRVRNELFAKGDEHIPNVYYYNFDGYAGKFIVVDKDGEKVAITIPQSDLKIVPHYFNRSQSVSDVSAWTIYTPNGTVYTFGGDYVETTEYDIDYSEYYMKNTGYLGGLEHHYRPSSGYNYPNRFNSVRTNTGWYLNKINTPYNNDSITFEYGNPYSSPLSQATIQHLVNYETNREEIRKYKILEGTISNQRKIKKISSLSGSIDFQEGVNAISSITVKNKSEEIIHHYKLDYKRKDDDHFLTSVQEIITDCIKKPPYRFEYLDINGTRIYQDPDYPGFTWDGLPGGLQKIIYPEGGYTKFVYEANRADVSEWEYKDVEERIVLLKDTYDTLDTRHIEVDHAQNIHVRASHYYSDYRISIKEFNGTEIATRLITDSLDFTVPVVAGKYSIVIDHVNMSSVYPDVIVHLKWKQKWLTPNTNTEAKGWRVKKVIIHDGIDTTKNIVKTYKYELDNGNSSGRLIAPPLRFPENQSDYTWQSGSFDAYTYNYYVYESKTSLYMTNYNRLSCRGDYHYTDITAYYNYYNLGVPEWYPSSGYDTLARLKSYKVYTSLPNYLKGATQIQYTKVTEQYGENAEQGYVENYFSYENNEIETSAPMFTTKDNSWKRGFPIKTKVFDKEGNIISETTSEYEFSSLATHPNQHHEENTLSLIDRTASYNPIANLYYPCNDDFYYNNYAQRFMVGHHYGKEVSGSIFLKKTTTTNYDQDLSGNSITSTTEYEYSDKYLFPKRVIQHENNGDKTISESKYVLDYDLDQTFTQEEAATLKVMKDLHIISPVIEQTVWKQKAGQSNKRLLGASLNTFQVYQTTVFKNLGGYGGGYNYYFSLMPLATYVFEPTDTWQPISDTNFSFSTITSGNLVWNNRYEKRVTYEACDKFGNITYAKEPYATPSTTIFGYNGLFPVASVAGASDRQVAYEGFELYGEVVHENIRNDAFRGKYSSKPFAWYHPEGDYLYRYLIFPNFQKPIPNGTYTISFWSKGSGTMRVRSSYGDSYGIHFTGSNQEWVYNKKDIVVSYDPIAHEENENSLKYRFSGNQDTRIDEIRLHPKGSFMTTTTYKPLVGVTHTTDTEQRTSSYYYDPLRRIESVRDHKNNLIKSYEYKYISEDDNPNPLFSISTNPTPEALINTSVTALVNQTDFNRCLNSTSSYPHKWDFGDGSPILSYNSQVINRNHTYTQEGTYVITLSVEVVTGYWVDAHTSIRIIDPSSPSDLTNELRVTLTGTVDLTNSMCYDLVATPNGGIPPFTYQWFSGDGTSNPTQTTEQINYCYTSFGNFTPRVIITDATGATAEATFDLTIINDELRAEIISLDEVCMGRCAFLEADVNGGSPDYTYLWEIINPLTNVNMTLGTTPSISFKIPNPSYANQYTIYLTVTDSDGEEVTTTKTIEITERCDPSPTGGFTLYDEREHVDPNEISVGDNVYFTSPHIFDRYTYTWTILYEGVVIASFSTSDPTIPVSFDREGNYTIICDVTQLSDQNGTISTLPIGTNTINISICSALILPKN